MQPLLSPKGSQETPPTHPEQDRTQQGHGDYPYCLSVCLKSLYIIIPPEILTRILGCITGSRVSANSLVIPMYSLESPQRVLKKERHTNTPQSPGNGAVCVYMWSQTFSSAFPIAVELSFACQSLCSSPIPHSLLHFCPPHC